MASLILVGPSTLCGVRIGVHHAKTDQTTQTALISVDRCPPNDDDEREAQRHSHLTKTKTKAARMETGKC